jgi:threonine synthase
MGIDADAMASRIVCRGCGYVAPHLEPYPFTCPRSGDGSDHVLRRRLDDCAVLRRLGDASDPEPQPFVRYRHLLHAYHLAVAGGLGDDGFVDLVRSLDAAVAEVAGSGLAVTPFGAESALGEGIGAGAPVWVKDETGNVAGSHKARHLFGLLVHLEVVERLALTGASGRRSALAIASCGNAALAAAVVAAAGGRSLEVFVPTDADGAVVSRLGELGARVTSCERRPDEDGDPAYRSLLRATRDGAVPFTCQGNVNGLAIEGGETLGYEMVESLLAAGETLDHVVVQVGGGALASAVAAAFSEARSLGAIDRLPRISTVQTEGAWPLKRAYERVRELAAEQDGADQFESALSEASRRRRDFMWPWETAPHSIAYGILDDETYDWVAVVEAMLATGGEAVVVSEEALAKAHALAVETTGIRVDPTGTAGLAGLMKLLAQGAVKPGERTAVLFTGAMR